MLELPVDAGFERQQEFIVELKESVKHAVGELFVDCSKVEQVTSTHVNILWRAYSICKDSGVRMILKNPTESVVRVLSILDLREMFLIDESNDYSKVSQEGTQKPQTLDNLLSMKIKLESSEIATGLKRVQEFLKSVPVTSACSVEIETIFYELATNVLLYSKLTSSDLLDCSVEVTKNRITMKFIDSGVLFDPSTAEIRYDPKSMISNYQKRGLGLVMIRRMADTISYERRDDGVNIVTVMKDWR